MNVYMEFFLLGLNMNVLGTVHGSGGGDGNAPTPLIESNFRDGIYKISNNTVARSSIWIEDIPNWGVFPTITPGLGVVQQAASSTTLVEDDKAMVFPSGLMGTTINLTDGFTVLLEGSVVYTFNPDGVNNVRLDAFYQMNFFDDPAYSINWKLVDETYYAQQPDGSVVGNNRTADISNNADLFLPDTLAPLTASPQIVRLAATFSGTHVAFSLNGRPVQSVTPPAPPAAPNGVALSPTLTTQLTAATSALEYVAFYSKFANDADLMTLTAP